RRDEHLVSSPCRQITRQMKTTRRRRNAPRSFCFFSNDSAHSRIYTLSLHDALPISAGPERRDAPVPGGERGEVPRGRAQAPRDRDRKSTRLNSSHDQISYAVFCLKKKT